MEDLSWRARLARKNINILNIDNERWYYEFMYHPKPGQTKWCKTVHEVKPTVVPPINVKELFLEDWTKLPIEKPTYEETAAEIETEVLNLRKELEQ